MKRATRIRTVTTRLPKLAVTALFFLGLSTNTHLDAATPWTLEPVAHQPSGQSPHGKTSDAAKHASEGIQVLSAQDEQLYRAAFAAQERGDWATADQAIALIKDRRLTGYVLADRFARRDMSLNDAKAWMVSYADHPQAETVYAKARKLPGFASANIPRPVRSALWSGDDGHETPTGFRRRSGNDLTAAQERILARVNNHRQRGDALAARELLTAEIQRGSLSMKDAADTAAAIAASLYYNGQVERARPLARQAAEAGADLGLWIGGLAAWKQHDYAEAQRSFAELAEAKNLTAWDRATAAFWAYRSAHASHDDAAARQWLAKAAQTPRSFYGYLAANMLGRPASPSWKVPDLSPRAVSLLSQKPGGWRALALVQVGKTALADYELRRLDLSGRRELQVAVLALSQKAALPALSLQLGGMARNDNGQTFDAAQYPLPPWQPEDGFKVDRALIYALMKRESEFNPSTVSSSGACGLMQVMPSTARQISGDAKRFGGCNANLLDPGTNLAVAQKYVRFLTAQPQIGDSLIKLLAAYNGGPGNLSRWLDGDERKDPLLFMESLPVRETRDYVQHVMLHFWMYRSRLAQPESSVAQLARGEWPRFAVNDNAPRGIKVAAIQE